MKYAVMVSVVMFIGCRDAARIGYGIYVRYAEGEYARVWDTLVVKELEDAQVAFAVERCSGVQRNQHGEWLPKENRRVKSVVERDESGNGWFERKTGKIYVFAGRSVRVENAVYKKLE
jgi:hypothetical protein